MSEKWLIRGLSIIAGLSLAGLVAIGGYMVLGPADGGPQDGSVASKTGSVPIGGPFTLVTDAGETVTDKDFRGQFMLVFFGYTHCPDVCPTTLAELSNVMDQLGSAAEAVQPLFISVDPGRDTPEVMADYLKSFHPKIVGLTGTAAQVKAAANAYRVYHEGGAMTGAMTGAANAHKDHAGDAQAAGAESGMVTHSGYVYLMSPEGDYVTHFSVQTGLGEMTDAIRTAVAAHGPRPGGDA